MNASAYAKKLLAKPAAMELVSRMAASVIRSWISSLRFRCLLDDPAVNPPTLKRRGLYMFWHETLLVPAYTHARQDAAVLISRHRDGELIARTLKALGGRAIRGSTTRGGMAAIRQMLRYERRRHLAITPAGPRGPRRVIQMGAVYLASRGRMPLIPCGVGADGCWRLGSWDRMILPRPGRAASFVLGKPIDVPPDADRKTLETYRRRVETALNEVQNRAESVAAAARPPAEAMTLAELRQV